LLRFHSSQGKREHWTAIDGPLCRRHKVTRDLPRRQDRVAPVVEADQLREQLGAQAVPIAFDAVDCKLHAGIRRCGRWPAKSSGNVVSAD
jgi:hypothetical protein